MEKITKEELMKMAQMTDEELDRIAAGLGFGTSCIDDCAREVPNGIKRCNNAARSDIGVYDEYEYRYCYDQLMEYFEWCKSMC